MPILRNYNRYRKMKIHCRMVVAVAGAMLGATPVFGGETWDIAQCIRHAVEHNLQVRQGWNLVEGARVDHLQTKLNYLPNLNAGIGYNASFGRSLDPTTYNYVSEGPSLHGMPLTHMNSIVAEIIPQYMGILL